MSKSKFATTIFGKDLWKKFRKSSPEYANTSWKEFKARWDEITETIRNEAIMNPLGVKLPYFIGELKYQFLSYAFKANDLATSEQEQIELNHVNLTTRGKVAKIKWERRWATRYFKLLEHYAFEPDQRMNKIAKQYTLEHPERIRTARITLGRNLNRR